MHGCGGVLGYVGLKSWIESSWMFKLLWRDCGKERTLYTRCCC